MSTDVTELAQLVIEKPRRRGVFKSIAPAGDWWAWHAAYIDAREHGRTPDEAEISASAVASTTANQAPTFPAVTSFPASHLFQPWNADTSPASHASRRPGTLRSQSGRISRPT